MAVYGVDILGLATMGGAYGLGRKILAQVNGHSGTVRIWNFDMSVLGAVGIAAGLILLALLVHSAARFVSHTMLLSLMGRYESLSVLKIWDKLSGIQGESRRSDVGWVYRLVAGNGRALGTSARLVVMSISGTLTSLFFAALAVYSTPKMALIFLLIGVATFGFMLRNNRRAAQANRRSSDLAGQARNELKQLFKSYALKGDDQYVEAELHKLYLGGLAFRATNARAEQLYRVYQSQFLMASGAAFAIALAVLLPMIEKPKGGAVVPVAMTAAGLVLLKQAFGFAGSVAANLTRLNLRYQLLVDHQRFLKTGWLPDVILPESSEEEEEEEA